MNTFKAAKVIISFLLLTQSLGHAATRVVSNLNDSGVGSLRETVGLSNSNDNIVFDASLSGGTITLTSGPIAIGDRKILGDLLVNAPVTINGNGNSNIFTNPYWAVTTHVKGLHLTNGNSTWGGAILNQGNILVEDCVIDNCTASIGGAIYSEVAIGRTNSPQLTIVDCVLAGNTVSSTGGAISTRESGFSATNCTIQGNRSTLANPVASGACYFYHPISAPTFRNCIVWNNLSWNSTSNASITNLQGPVHYPTAYNYSLVENLNPGGTNLDGTNPANDPLFKAPIAPSSAPSVAGDLTPGLLSPVVDAGLNSYNTSPVDALWNTRTHNTTIDLGAIEQQSNIIYARSSVVGGNADGSSWADAYPHLQSALAAAQSGDIIWVAAGTYYPDEGTGQTNNLITSTFQLKSGVEIYGGFPAAGGTWSQRDFNTHTTTLSGDIDANGTPTNNAYHVVTGNGTDATAILDGFTITAGNATTESGRNHIGAGIVCDFSGDPIFRNIIVTGNSASAVGGGAYLNAASPTFINAIFSNNQTPTAGGGVNGEGAAIYHNNSNATYINCIFSGNKATNDGGAVSNHASNPQFINCTFSGNSSDSNGGAIYNTQTSNPTLKNCIIWNNEALGSTASTSASIYNIAPSTPNITYSLIANSGGSSWNSAIGTDGGNNIDLDPLFTSPVSPASAPTATGNFTLQNISQALNAGNNADNTEATDLAGNTRIQDTLIDLGAYESSSNVGNPSVTTLILTTVTTTDATTLAFSIAFSEAVTNFNDASDLIISTTGNLAYTGLSISGAGAVYTLSLTGVSGEGSLNITIRNDSDIQDTIGSGLLASSTLANISRLSSTSPIHYVRAGNPGAAAPYTTWATAATDLQDALILANLNDAIHVAAGTYYPTTGSDRNISFALKDSISIFGGFPAAGGTLSERYPSKHTTTLSGDLNQDDNFPSANMGDNSYHVVTASSVGPTAILDGFTISGGNATDSASSDTRRGGGIYCTFAQPSIINCIFQSNLADFGAGAGVYWASTPHFQKCQFRGNEAYEQGGAVSNYSGGSTAGSNATYTNCLFSGNRSQEGGAIRNRNSNPVFTNCTIANNFSYQRGAAFFNENSSLPVLFNSLIYGNEAGDIGDGNDGVIYNTNSLSYNTYNNTMCEVLGDNDNSDGVSPFDPQFVSPVPTSNNPTSAGDYMLSPSSTAINFDVGSTPTHDIRGHARNDGRIDLGAYEYSLAIINTHIDELDSPVGATTSLREAITHFPPFDAITIDPSLAEQTITLTLGELIPNQNIDLDASSLSAPVTIDANGQTTDHRVLSIPSGITAAFTNFVFTGGKTPRGASPWVDALPGGGIHNLGTLTLNLCTISNNHTGMGGDDVPGEAGAASKGGHGGGIYNAGTLTITQCNIINNSTGASGDARAASGYGYEGNDGGSGGGIYNTGNLNIQNSSVVGNTTGAGGQSGDAGVAGNGGHGGGIYTATLNFTAINVTIHGNSTGIGGPSPTDSQTGIGGDGGSGGGIYVHQNLSASLIQCTITDNTTGIGGTGMVSNGDQGMGGGGSTASVTVALHNTLIATNNGNTGAPDFFHSNNGTLLATGINLIGNITGSSLSGRPNVIVHADPMLGPLNDYGGPTWIRLPQTGSPAIDPTGGSTTSPLTAVDQRGLNRIVGTTVDIGAIEHQGTGPELGFLWNTDLDNDGLAFGIEYGFNKNPDVADAYSGGPIYTINPTTHAISFSTPNPALPFVAYQVSRSTDLNTFTPLFNTIGLDIFNLPAGLTVNVGVNSFEFTYTDPNAPSDKAFYRVEAIYVAP